jgi:DNA/RNA-binding domain of Phe-tRNA-synthetase-like protein
MISGYSISGFDIDKIAGNEIILGIGKENEPYEGIGKGMLNIEYLPVYRDSIGGIGTPTSDNERTKLDLDSTRILIIINSYSGKDGLTQATDMVVQKLIKYAQAENTTYLNF